MSTQALFFLKMGLKADVTFEEQFSQFMTQNTLLLPIDHLYLNYTMVHMSSKFEVNTFITM